MDFRIACAQPKVNKYLPEEKKLDVALEYIDRAAETGSKILCFPEGFPGPYAGELNWSAFDEISKKAKEYDMCVIYGEVEANDKEPETNSYFLVSKFVDSDGKLGGSYRRMHPTPNEVNFALMNGKVCAPGDDFFIHEVDGVKIGIIICSEIFNPELSRVLALEGVEIIFAPIGGMIYELRDAWRCVLWARAIENLCYTATCLSLFGMEDGLAMISSPEKILAESKEEGLVFADCDIDRVRWLRSQDESLELPKPYKVVPGSTRMRRPEKYAKLVDESVEIYNFYHYK